MTDTITLNVDIDLMPLVVELHYHHVQGGGVATDGGLRLAAIEGWGGGGGSCY